MRPFIKDITDTITVNTKKAMLTEHPYTEPNLYKHYVRNTAGNYWIDSDLISLSHGQWSKQQCAQTFECIEKQVCKTITHETVHRVIYGQTNIKACYAFDNIAKSLAEYGLW